MRVIEKGRKSLRYINVNGLYEFVVQSVEEDTYKLIDKFFVNKVKYKLAAHDRCLVDFVVQYCGFMQFSPDLEKASETIKLMRLSLCLSDAIKGCMPIVAINNKTFQLSLVSPLGIIHLNNYCKDNDVENERVLKDPEYRLAFILQFVNLVEGFYYEPASEGIETFKGDPAKKDVGITSLYFPKEEMELVDNIFVYPFEDMNSLELNICESYVSAFENKKQAEVLKRKHEIRRKAESAADSD